MPLNKKKHNTHQGFTLIEVMVTVVVLSLGIVLIYEALFTSVNAFSYCSNYFKTASWTEEKIWQAQDNLSRLGPLAKVDTAGAFISRNRKFNWHLSYKVIDDKSTLYLYKIDFSLLWAEGKRKTKLIRTAYAIYEEE